jgi:hypothetical protein
MPFFSISLFSVILNIIKNKSKSLIDSRIKIVWLLIICSDVVALPVMGLGNNKWPQFKLTEDSIIICIKLSVCSCGSNESNRMGIYLIE